MSVLLILLGIAATVWYTSDVRAERYETVLPAGILVSRMGTITVNWRQEMADNRQLAIDKAREARDIDQRFIWIRPANKQENLR